MKFNKILILLITLAIANISAMEGEDFADHPVQKMHLEQTHLTIRECDRIIDEIQKQDMVVRQELESVFCILSDIGKINFKNMSINLLKKDSNNKLANEIINMIPNVCKKISLVTSKQCNDLKQNAIIINKNFEKIQWDLLYKRAELAHNMICPIFNEVKEKTFVAKKAGGGFWNFLFGNSKNGYKALEPD